MKNLFVKGLTAMFLICFVATVAAQNGVRSTGGTNQSLCFAKGYDGNLNGNDIRNVNSVYEQDFSGTWPPAGWTIAGAGQTNWIQGQSANAGGIAPEGRFSWSPQFNGTSRFISPAINTTGYSTLAVQFKHYVDNYGGGNYSVKLETSPDGTNWTEVFSVAPNANIGPETVTAIVNQGLGGENFHIAFTFSGNSFNINYWYFDDLILFEAMSNDASAVSINIAQQVPVDLTFEPNATVGNEGTETISFSATLEFELGGTTIYSSTKNVTNLAAFTDEIIPFDDWTSVLGDYTAHLTVTLTGDENLANNELSMDFQVLEGMVFKKQLVEVFTSSTCPPCATANPIIDGLLEDNPGAYSLIKYQMNWPGSGDIYYTQQGGDRKDYYGVAFVPDLFINADRYTAGDLSQTLFDQYAAQVTAMDIEVTSSIDDSGIITVNATLNPYANYEAGLKAHIVVVEKTTVGNVGSNGETYFHNVMMIMLPGSSGTTLGALTENVPVQISQGYNMNETNMEEPTDLAVIVFVQNDNNKQIVQSQMVDVQAGGFITYSITFNVEDSDGNLVEGAEVTLESQAPQTTNAQGQTTFAGVFPGVYSWEVTKAGLESEAGSVTLTDEDVDVDVVLDVPDFLFYEDFGANIPSEWTTIQSGANFIYWFDGKVIIFRQQATGELWLISPSIDMSEAETLFIEVGSNSGNPLPMMVVGTVPDPANTAAFTQLASMIPPVSGYEDFAIDMSTYSGTDSYIAITYDGPTFGYFYIETVKIEGSTVRIGDNELKPSTLISPNPAREIITISAQSELENVRIFNRLGQVVLNTKASGQSASMSTNNLPPGLYLVEISTSIGVEMQKLILN